MKPGTTHTFMTTAAAIDPYLIVQGNTSDLILAATAATQKLIGTTDSVGAEASSPTGIALDGVGEVRLGGNVAFGAPITSNNASKGVTAAGVAGETHFIIGYALKAGVADDVIPYRIAAGVIVLPAA